MRNRRAIFVFVAVVLAVALVGVARVRMVRSAQDELLATITRQIEILQAEQTSIAGVEQAIQDVTRMQKTVNSKKLGVAAMGTAGALAAAAVAALACGTVAWFIGSARALVCMGLWVWLVNGAAVGAITQYGSNLVAGLLPLPDYWYPGVPTRGFAAFFVVGLASTFLWQTLLPAAAAGFLGLKLRVWWFSVVGMSQGFESEPVAGTPMIRVPAEKSRTCPCGAVNLIDRASCYACGSSLWTTGEQGQS